MRLFGKGSCSRQRFHRFAKYAIPGCGRSSPHDTEPRFDLFAQQLVRFLHKRIGRLYNDNGSFQSGRRIDPVQYTELFFNYTVNRRHYFAEQVSSGFNNLFDKPQYRGVSPWGRARTRHRCQVIFYPEAGRNISVSATFG